MTAVLPDDPYHALGLDKDATSAAIKTAYRKLVLKHHPDKVQDDSLKQSAADLFHKIQSAWETIGDEDKRSRYDAQCKLAALRKEAMMDRVSPTSAGPRPDMRSASYRSPNPDVRSYPPRDSSFRVEEIRPQEADYLDKGRREYEDRARRSPPRDDHRRSKVTRQDSKESDRVRRQEKVRQSTKATTRDRDAKYSSYGGAVLDSGSDSDHYDRRIREREAERERERRARDRYYEETRKQREASQNQYFDERTFSRAADAKEYMRSTQRQYSDPDRRTSPTRISPREEQGLMFKDGRPSGFRRPSGKPKQSYDDSDTRRRREAERTSSDYDDSPRRPPNLASTKSAPHDIRIPYDKPRASSLQHSRAEMEELIPGIRRSDSMPISQQMPTRSKPVRHQSNLRQAQNSTDDYEPRRSQQSYPPQSGRSQKAYADDYEVPTTKGYIIEDRTPNTRTRSPEPLEKSRSSSSRYQTAPVLPRLDTRTSYKVTGNGVEPVSASRPRLSRGDSGRADSGRGSSRQLFGEIGKNSEPYSAPADSTRYYEARPEVKVSPSYNTSRRASEARPPTYMRGSSFNAVQA